MMSGKNSRILNCNNPASKINKPKKESFFKPIHLYFFILFFIGISLLPIAMAQVPSPHNIQGRVYIDNTKTTGVPGGLPVTINDTVNGNVVKTFTLNPGPPPLRGTYSAVISGNDGDLVIVSSWNATHFGQANTTLLSSTTTIDVVLNRSRNSEPNVTILFPLNNSIFNTTTPFNLTANITILGADATNCNASIFFSNNALNITPDQNATNQLGNIVFQSHRLTTWNLSGVRDGTLNVTVRAQCLSDNIILEKSNAYTIFLTIRDTTPPRVQLISPTNNSFSNVQNITFFYNITENTGIKNCSIYLDNLINESSYSVETAARVNITVNKTLEGTHSWFISCIDNGSNFLQANSSFFRFTTDITPPNVTLIALANLSKTPNNTIQYLYNATDNFGICNCSLIVNSSIYQHAFNESILLNKSNNFTQFLRGGIYSWQVNCTDNASLTSQSAFFLINITDPDLKINSSDISFVGDFSAEGQSIIINATIFNLGADNATNVTIQFFENDPAMDGLQIGSNATINVSAFGNTSVNVSYVTRVGMVGIYTLADPNVSINGSILEMNESNNIANRSIEIVPYHLFYGDFFASLFLDQSSEYSLIQWANISNSTGNIYVADSDSIIDFTSLQALGRNTTGNRTLNDFEELDFALNLTNLGDSLNDTYTELYLPINTKNISVFSSIINFTPIANSTNTSSFVTGILWDMSDDTLGTGHGQYNGSEDVIFVTQINQSTLGTFGLYDYELKTPSNLRRYLVPNTLDTISFYREIT